jgi:aminopeptidase N
MSSAKPPVRLADYRPSAYRSTRLELEFDLDPAATRVAATTWFERTGPEPADLWLDGEDFAVEALELDGQPLPVHAVEATAHGLCLRQPPAAFRLRVVTRLQPAANTALSGLYLSGGRFCTQCEAEGFRRITYAQDRPDCLSVYTVRLTADAEEFPTLLANGNPVAQGALPGGRHFAVWHDPFPKPAYLFAVAAGRYETVTGSFTTRSGREVALAVHVDPGAGGRAAYALDSLQRAMAWDEQTYGREYDLDVYNLVAVRDFNFGAMENKGLNIFNSAYVLADPATATDGDYEGIEAVIGHEYFHNWTGNRITCRDWFQLALKEGLTVFREQQFSAAMRSPAVQRLLEVRRLRSRQFAEDQGPLAHPVRPASYHAIDNFYTATVYEKGAEVVRMLHTVLGEAAFQRGMQCYFTERDGTASTIEDFVGCLGRGAGVDLGRFLAWYDQAGTPEVTVRRRFDAARSACVLELAQRTAPTPGQAEKQPLPIPLRLGWLDAHGQPVPTTLAAGGRAQAEHLVVLDQATATVECFGAFGAQPPVPALLRGFSAPVHLRSDLDAAERRLQMAHDADPFTRWEAGQELARQWLFAAAEGQAPDAAPFVHALGIELERGSDPAFQAMALRLPDLGELLQLATTPDPEALAAARTALRRQIATTLEPGLVAVATRATPTGITATAAGARARRAVALDLLAALGSRHEALLVQAFAQAGNLTDTMAALEALGQLPGGHFDRALAAFRGRWQAEPLVLDKWFAVQAAADRSDAHQRLEQLRAHPDYDLGNPNRVRALARVFATQNLRAFHQPDGRGYRFLAEVVAAIDPRNPALAARLLQPFESWRRFDQGRQQQVRAALEGLAARGLSTNSREMLDRTLA